MIQALEKVFPVFRQICDARHVDGDDSDEKPVLSPLPKNPPDFLRSSRRSRRRRQHMLRMSLGSMSLLMYFRNRRPVF
ncbi:MAG: hypothetical protein V8T87_02145 [Victivallales bacterium]